MESLRGFLTEYRFELYLVMFVIAVICAPTGVGFLVAAERRWLKVLGMTLLIIGGCCGTIVAITIMQSDFLKPPGTR